MAPAGYTATVPARDGCQSRDQAAARGPLPGGREGTTVVVEPILTGTMACPRAFIESSASASPTLRMLGIGTPRSRWLKIPIPAFLSATRRPARSWSTPACTPRSRAKPAENLGRIDRRASRDPRIEPGEDLPAQLRARGVDPKSLKLVVMTHMHFDHTSGMSEFPGATFVITEDEWIAAATDSRPFLRGYRPAHFDYAFDYRTLSYDSDAISSYATFGRTFDLFGDGSVRLASTPGTAPGTSR